MSRSAGFTAKLLSYVLAALLSGCGQSSPEKLEQSWKSLTSWRRSLHEAASLYARGAVPALYLEQVTRAAAEELDKLRQDVAGFTKSAPRAGQLEAQLQQLRQWRYELSMAAAHDDRDAARWIADGLATADRDAKADDAGGGLP
jgi:hypothetical protein